MPKTLTIDPITRIEGHAKITLHMTDDGRVEEARFHVTQMRGFEKFCEGRPVEEMPRITTRICGVRPEAHMMAAAKAADAVYGITLPVTARLLRELGGRIDSLEHDRHWAALVRTAPSRRVSSLWA